jgi:hypothetical protein
MLSVITCWSLLIPIRRGLPLLCVKKKVVQRWSGIYCDVVTFSLSHILSIYAQSACLFIQFHKLIYRHCMSSQTKSTTLPVDMCDISPQSWNTSAGIHIALRLAPNQIWFVITQHYTWIWQCYWGMYHRKGMCCRLLAWVSIQLYCVKNHSFLADGLWDTGRKFQNWKFFAILSSIFSS